MIADLSLRRVHSTLGTAVALVLGLTFVLLLSTPARAGPGDLDPTFGGDGKVMTPLGQQAICALATAVLPDGRILVVGQSEFPSMDFTWGLVLARYNANGSLDRSFGDNGLVHLEFGADSVSGKAIAVQPDGKVVVAGESGGYESRDFFLARFNSYGSLDTTFGTDGMVRTDITGSGDTGQALAIQTNGRIIVVGSTETAESANDLAVVRYHPNGSLDTNFDGDGKVVLNLGSPEDYGSDIAIQPDGKIVVSGVAGNELALARLLPDGSLDNGFAHQGIFTHDLGFSGNTLQIQADSKIVVVGDGYTSYTGSIIGLARLSSGGSLDRTFGNQGVVITSFTPGTNSYDDFGTDVIIETNGRIIVAGSAETATDKDFALARYLPDGRLDSSFGNGGLVTTDFAGRFDASYSLALQLDGKIIGVGNTEAYGNWPLLNSDFALARYHPNGSLDVGFGVAGRVTSNFELGQSLARSVAVQADNKIVVAGSAYEGGQTGWDFALVRYNLDGSLDSAFGTDGIVTTDFGHKNDDGEGIVIQSDGKIVVAGTARVNGVDRFALARYLRNGTLDQAFGSGGTVTTPSISGSAKGSAVAIQPDGKIIVVGASFGFALARYHANGSLDSSFGTGGTITIALGNDGFFGGANDIVLQADGKIVVAGTDHLNFALARFTREGALDHTFGQDGTIITDLGSNDWCNGVVIQTDGKIVAAGDTENGWDFALARYNPNGTLDPTFGTGGISITDLGSQARGRDAEIQPDGKILVAGAVWEGAFALAQYRLDGTLDETFGTGGIVVTDFSEIPGMGMSVALQTNGKIVMVGYAADTITLARYEGRDVPTTYLPMIMQASEHYAVPGE